MKRNLTQAVGAGAMPCLVALTLSGCVSSQLAPTVVSYNRAVATAQNEMLLLNIVRAAKRKPMYLVDMSKITGSLKRDLGGSLTVPFGSHGGGTGANDVAMLQGTYSVNPTFDVSVLNTQEFMTGFLQPVTPDQFRYFLETGWSPALLLHLFVAEVRAGDDPKSSYVNDPQWNDETDKDLRAFGEWATQFAENEPRLIVCEEAFGPTLKGESVAKLADLTAAAKEGYGLTQTPGAPGDYQLRVPQRGTWVIVPRGMKAPCSRSSRSEAAGTRAQPTPSRLGGFVNEKQFELVLRSPEAILYYLGQIVRLEAVGRFPRALTKRDYGVEKDKVYDSRPIFVAVKDGRAAPACRRSDVRVVDDEGELFVVPGSPWPPKKSDQVAIVPNLDLKEKSVSGSIEPCDAGMSGDVLQILTQLIALHKSAKDFPGTTVVRAIGQ